MQFRNTFNKIAFDSFIFVLLLTIILGCGQLKPTRKATPDFQISVKELENELNENRNAAISKYKNKTVAIKGKVDAKMGLSVILVSPENGRFPVQCFFDTAERDSFRQVQRGMEYTFIGVFMVTEKSSATTISDCKLY